MTQKKITHIDCFSGPGGICTGFKAAGIKTLLAIEKVDSCVETYSANHPEVKVIHKDIRLVTSKEVLAVTKGQQVDIVTSGMPCETFSTAGSKSRSAYDNRQQLYLEAIRIASIVNAKIILFENVPGIESKKVEQGGARLIVEDILDELASHGYSHYIKVVLNAKDFGVPQSRNRFFLLASRDASYDLKVPIAIHGKYVTVQQAFAGLPKVSANENREITEYGNARNDYIALLKDKTFWKVKSKNNKLTYHLPPNHRPATLERFKLIGPGESLVDLFRKFDSRTVKSLQNKKILPKKWYIQRNKRLLANDVSKTVTSHCLDELIHPKLDRALTVREVARLQSFPDSYDFKGGPFICPHIYETQDKYEQIGDAVPPLLAYHWGVTLIEILQQPRKLYASRM